MMSFSPTLKVKAIADAKIKTDQIDATVLAHLLRADLMPEAWAPGERARELRVALHERIHTCGCVDTKEPDRHGV